MKIAILLLLILFSFSCRKSTPVVTKTKHYQCTVHLNELNKAKYIEVSQDGNLLKTIDYQYEGNKLTISIRNFEENTKSISVFQRIGNKNYLIQCDTSTFSNGFVDLCKFRYVFNSDSTFNVYFTDYYNLENNSFKLFTTYRFSTMWDNNDLIAIEFYPGAHVERSKISTSSIVDSVNLFPMFISDYEAGGEAFCFKNHHLNSAVSYLQFDKFTSTINRNYTYDYRLNQDQRVDEIVKHYMESSLEYLTEITQVVYVK